jgi:hypothetical protein
MVLLCLCYRVIYSKIIKFAVHCKLYSVQALHRSFPQGLQGKKYINVEVIREKPSQRCYSSKFSVTYSTISTVPTLGISGDTPTIIHLHGAHTDFVIPATRFVNLTFFNLVSIIICEGYILQSSSLRNFLIIFYNYHKFNL